jgi:four helix bundle protein
MRYTTFEEMPVWQKAMDLGLGIFKITENLPKKEDYGLTSQIRSSALSVPGNITEGFGRQRRKDKINFYYNERSSLTETKSHLIYGSRVGYFEKTQFDEHIELIEQVWKELNSLINSLQKGS